MEQDQVVTHHGHLVINKSQTLYWNHHAFWPIFLADDHFDHWHFIDVFKTIIADIRYRKVILQHFLPHQSISVAHCDHCVTVNDHIGQFKHTIRRVIQRGRHAYLSWRYPPIFENGDRVTHYTMILIDPDLEQVLSFDSRGLDYASQYHSSWNYCLQSIKQYTTSMGYRWMDMNFFDIQSLSEYDQFCQTWSILLVLEYICQNHQREEHNFWLDGRYGFATIIRLWKYLITELPEIREACFYQIYRQTHTNEGDRIYNRYFSTLEALVHGDNLVYYAHEVGYDCAGYTFLEDFWDLVDEELFHQMLA